MKRINLDGTWELQGSAHEATMDPAGEWIPATVPGDVHVDLMAAGKLDGFDHHRDVKRSTRLHSGTGTETADTSLTREHRAA